MISNRRTSCIRQWSAGASLAAAAAVIGMGAAHADTDDELLGQAGADLTQATQVLDSIPSTALDAHEALFVDGAIGLQNSADQLIGTSDTLQDGLPAADQASAFVLDADQQLAQASQELLTADQGFLSAIDAGDLSTVSGAFEAELPVVEGMLTDFSAVFDVGFTDLVAGFDPSILTAF